MTQAEQLWTQGRRTHDSSQDVRTQGQQGRVLNDQLPTATAHCQLPSPSISLRFEV
jgi:hypothetical protein